MRPKAHSITALLLLATLILAACGGGGTTTQSPTAAPAAGGQATAAPAAGGGEATAAPAAAGGGEATAAPAAAGDTGKVVVFGAFTGPEATAFEEVVKAFEAANPGIDVTYTGSSDFDTAIVVKIQAGDTPDIAGWPQPGGLARQARDGQLVPLWPEITALIDKNYPSFWKDLGSVDGQPYGIFHRVNAKGWIWYNKAEFEKAGYTAPKTWDELTALTEKMKASGTPPWCEGIESGAATGWKGTDWIENIMLRTQSVETYDKWIAGTLPFSSPEVKNAFEILGKIWLDPTAVYGGQQTIALTRVPDAANFLLNEALRAGEVPPAA